MELELSPLSLPGIDAARPTVIAGPCSAETEEQVLTTARQLFKNGIKIFRAGIWKPRTKPGGFEGVGEKGLPWLVRVKEELGMLISTEVAMPAHVEASLQHGMDLLWVGARTVVNPFAMQELADALRGVDIPVLVKNPVNPDLELYDKRLYRNPPLWHLPIELRRRIPNLPIFGDPSHTGGSRELIAPLCQQAMDLGFDGLIVESHCCPDAAWSDASQQVTPDVLGLICDKLVIREVTDLTENLESLRKQIDECDNALLDLLARRMRICREIGAYKRDHNMAIVQTNRYSEILDKRGAQGSLCGVNARFVRELFELIHEESIAQQVEVMNK